MVSIRNLCSYQVGTFVLNTKFNIKQYYEFSNVFISREEDEEGNGHLFAYGYSNNDYKVIWKFPDKDVFAICRIIPSLQKESDFITPEHYIKYMEKYKDNELIEVYSSNWPYDFRYVVDANTGEIYDKMESR